MRFTTTLIIIMILFCTGAGVASHPEKGIYVPDVGDGWKNKVDSAITLIKTFDREKYEMLRKYCDTVEFIVSDHSSVKYESTIALSVEDVKLGSVNNIASALVHESRHLYFHRKRIVMDPRSEEIECYSYEYDFLCSLPEVEDILFLHTVRQIIHYQRKLR